MPATVHLNDIIDALEMQFDEALSYLDLDAGQVVTVSEDLPREAAEQGDGSPMFLTGRKTNGRSPNGLFQQTAFIKLPTKFDVHEWGIMQDFSRSVGSDDIRDDLSRAIHGTGAFRNFKGTVRRLGIESAWFAFRTDALRQIALDWCEENQIVRQ